MNMAYHTPYRAGSPRALLHPRGEGLDTGLLLGWVGMTRLSMPQRISSPCIISSCLL